MLHWVSGWLALIAIVAWGQQIGGDRTLQDVIFTFDESCLLKGVEVSNLASSFSPRVEEGKTGKLAALWGHVVNFIRPSQKEGDVGFLRMMEENLADAVSLVEIEGTINESNGSNRTSRRLSEEKEMLEKEKKKIFGGMYLMAVTEIVGIDKVAEVVQLDKQGKQDELIHFLVQSTKDLPDEQRQVINRWSTVTREESLSRRRLSATKEDSQSRSGKIVEVEHLEMLDLDIVKVPIFLSGAEGLVARVKDTPCLQIPVEPNRFLRAFSRIGKHPQDSSVATTERGYQSESVQVRKEHRVAKSEEDALAAVPYSVILPNDPGFNFEWHLGLGNKGRSKPQGVNAINGWWRANQNLRESGYQTGTEKANMNEMRADDLRLILEPMTIAVLDTGCAAGPDMDRKFWTNPDDPDCASTGKEASLSKCVGGNFADSSDILKPTIEHGTGTASVIAALTDNNYGIAGVCPQCNVACLQITGANSAVPERSAVLKAINFVLRKGIKVSNHSYGAYEFSRVELQAFNRLNDANHLVVAAAGNEGCNLDTILTKGCIIDGHKMYSPFYPAALPIESVISVGASDIAGLPTWFTNYGETSVHVFAPGADIVTLDGQNIVSVSGTSFSSPLVAGVAGFLWTMNPDLSNVQLKQLILDGARGNDELLGKAMYPGIVDMDTSLDLYNPIYKTPVHASGTPSTLMMSSGVGILAVAAMMALIWRI